MKKSSMKTSNETAKTVISKILNMNNSVTWFYRLVLIKNKLFTGYEVYYNQYIFKTKLLKCIFNKHRYFFIKSLLI